MAKLQNDPTITPTSHRMTGYFFLPDFGDKDTPEENDAFYKTHFVNAGKTFPRPKGFLQSWKELILDILKGNCNG